MAFSWLSSLVSLSSKGSQNENEILDSCIEDPGTSYRKPKPLNISFGINISRFSLSRHAPKCNSRGSMLFLLDLPASWGFQSGGNSYGCVCKCFMGIKSQRYLKVCTCTYFRDIVWIRTDPKRSEFVATLILILIHPPLSAVSRLEGNET